MVSGKMFNAGMCYYTVLNDKRKCCGSWNMADINAVKLISREHDKNRSRNDMIGIALMSTQGRVVCPENSGEMLLWSGSRAALDGY
jgi:hypothetical protein